MSNKTEGAIKKGKSIDIGNIVYKRDMMKAKQNKKNKKQHKTGN